ncbi:hypothetical protein HY383_02620 [Candidatus Daviesbacteria bacterium]|nr:hypothetical protein [Candidatus Daviesbacteria bacterium]
MPNPILFERKNLLFFISLTVVILTVVATLLFNNFIIKTVPKSEIDAAANQAIFLYRQRKERGENFSNGPCLSNALMANWVVDTVHNPRLPIDDLPENQCVAYLEGRVEHFVELDIEGNLIRAK